MSVFGRRKPQEPPAPDLLEEVRSAATHVLAWTPREDTDDGIAGWELQEAGLPAHWKSAPSAWLWCYLPREAHPDRLADWVARQLGAEVILAGDTRQMSLDAGATIEPIYWVAPA